MIRTLTNADMLQRAEIYSLSFQFSLDRAAAVKEHEHDELPPDETCWGDVREDGTLAAAVVDRHMHMRYEGRTVAMSGVAGVATRPECRMGGSVRAIFAKMLPEVRARGDMFSALYPFKHEFYRKFGYEVCYAPRVSTLPLDDLRIYRQNAAAHLYQPGEDFSGFAALYEAFTADCNLAVTRSEAAWRETLSADPYLKQEFAYLLTDERGPASYVRFRRKEGNMEVFDLAFRDPDAARSLFGFLYAFNAQMRTVSLELPSAYRACALLVNGRASKEEATQHAMARVIDVPGALSMLRTVDEPFVIEVRDDFLPENAGRYEVAPGRADRTEKTPDLSLDVTTLAQLTTGFLGLEGASLRADVRILGRENALLRAFPIKKTYTVDRF